jgi:hypothetical protein
MMPRSIQIAVHPVDVVDPPLKSSVQLGKVRAAFERNNNLANPLGGSSFLFQQQLLRPVRL